MLMVNYDGMSLPKDLLDEFKNNNVMGLFIKDGKIDGRTLSCTKFDMELISKMINDSIEHPEGKQLVIITKDARILFSLNVNSSNISIDENGYITVDIGTDTKVIHSINNSDFLMRNSREEINKNYARLSSIGFVERDESFKNGEFTSSFSKKH